jgi:hypothetical protein
MKFQVCLLGCTVVYFFNYFTPQYIPEDKSELHTRRRENFEISQIYMEGRNRIGYKGEHWI